MVDGAIIGLIMIACVAIGIFFERYLEYKINKQIIRREKYWSHYSYAKTYRDYESPDPRTISPDERIYSDNGNSQ